MKLINVDDIDWQEGVFVSPNAKEPLPIIHKIATIEMLRDWQKEVKAIQIDKIKKAREEMAKLTTPPQYHDEDYYICGVDDCLEILDKLISESEEK